MFSSSRVILTCGQASSNYTLFFPANCFPPKIQSVTCLHVICLLLLKDEVEIEEVCARLGWVLGHHTYVVEHVRWLFQIKVPILFIVFECHVLLVSLKR